MLKKTITFDDLDGNSLTEDFYFNLSKAEIARLELSTDGGFSDSLIAIVNAKEGGAIIKVFEDILKAAYGVRNVDGKTFEKSPELSQGFMQTDAYSVLFMELVTDAVASAAFINGIIPADLVAKADLDKPTGLRAVASPNVVVDQSRPIEDVALSQVAALSPAVREMTVEEMRAAIARLPETIKPLTP